MPRDAKLPRHGFYFALVETTTDGIEVDFHWKCKGAMTSPLRLKNDKIIEHNIHDGLRKCTGQQPNLTGGQSGILHLRDLKSAYIKYENVTDAIDTQMINDQSYHDM